MPVLIVLLMLLLLSFLGWRWYQVELNWTKPDSGRMIKFQRRRRGGRRLAP